MKQQRRTSVPLSGDMPPREALGATTSTTPKVAAAHFPVFTSWAAEGWNGRLDGGAGRRVENTGRSQSRQRKRHSSASPRPVAFPANARATCPNLGCPVTSPSWRPGRVWVFEWPGWGRPDCAFRGASAQNLPRLSAGLRWAQKMEAEPRGQGGGGS